MLLILEAFLKKKDNNNYILKKIFFNILKLNFKSKFIDNKNHKKLLFFKKFKFNSSVSNNLNLISLKKNISKLKRRSLLFLLKILKKNELKNPSNSFINNFFNTTVIKKDFNKISYKKKKVSINCWNNNEVVFKNFNLPLRNLKNILIFLTKTRISIFFVNALSITKFNWILEKRVWSKKMRIAFFKNMEKRFVTKYRYSAIYLKDLLCINFISFFFKKPSILLNFIAFQIVNIQKNKKETVLIKFLIKIMKYFANQRNEITGLKIKFKGRINRWRRTKSIVGTTRYISFQTFDSRIEYGTAKAINKKGAIGLRLWIAYAAHFEDSLKTTLFNYFTYSKDLYKKQVKQSLFSIAHIKSHKTKS